MRGSPGGEPVLLNKKTGWESRTEPPLYMLTVGSQAKAGHWDLSREGASEPQGILPARHQSEDLRMIFPIVCVDLDGVYFVAENRLRRQFWRRSPLFFQEVFP